MRTIVEPRFPCGSGCCLLASTGALTEFPWTPFLILDPAAMRDRSRPAPVSADVPSSGLCFSEHRRLKVLAGWFCHAASLPVGGPDVNPPRPLSQGGGPQRGDLSPPR